MFLVFEACVEKVQLYILNASEAHRRELVAVDVVEKIYKRLISLWLEDGRWIKSLWKLLEKMKDVKSSRRRDGGQWENELWGQRSGGGLADNLWIQSKC